MRFTNIIWLLLLKLLSVAPSVGVASPVHSRDIGVRGKIDFTAVEIDGIPTIILGGVDERQLPLLVGPVLDAVIQIIELVVIDILSDVFTAEDRESVFVQNSLAQLSQKYPAYNVLIFHDQTSKYSLQSKDPFVHAHYEFNVISLGPVHITTKGYEIILFDGPGWFELAGDGGWLNWGVTGCYSGTRAHIDFCTPPV